LLRDLATLVAKDRRITAEMLAHLAEVDARRLYAPAGYPSMHAYCIGEFHFSEEAAFKRIHAARTARNFPAILPAVADGRLHLSAVIMLAPHLTGETEDDLLAAAAHRTKSQIERLLAERRPQPEPPTHLEAITSSSIQRELTHQHAPGRVEEGVSQPIETRASHSKLAPLGAKRFAIQFTIDEKTEHKLRYAQLLFSHRIPPGDLARMFDRALEALIREGEKRKFGSTDRPRGSPRRATRNDRHIPVQVRRAVWERDRGQCAFVSENGHRCGARRFLEFDHVIPIARGGGATIDNLRLRCRAHNQYEAERSFGVDFMRGKRKSARQTAPRKAEAPRTAADEVIPWLRALGFRADEARWRAARCESIPDAPLEERVRLALSWVSPRVAPHRSAGP
jgi:hypothetical protein